MKAAIVVESGGAPIYGDFREPLAIPGKRLVRVTASSISEVAKSRVSGEHYSSPDKLPFVAGVDGTGIDEDGRRVYFMLPEAPYGAMGELCLVDEGHCIALPDNLSDDIAAAMAIPAFSSWAPLLELAKLRPGETVLINGATGTSGRLAIQIAKHLGAGKVIVTGRKMTSFDDLRLLGADVVIPLIQDKDELAKAFRNEFQQGIDIVLDYLWGMSAEVAMLAAAKSGRTMHPIRYVQIGSISGETIALPSAVLRSSSLLLMGSGMGSITFIKILETIQGAFKAAPLAGFKIPTKQIPLSEVATAWQIFDSSSRIVLRP